MTETQAKSGAAGAPTDPVAQEAEGGTPPAGRTVVGRAAVPAESSSPKFTRPPGMSPPPTTPDQPAEAGGSADESTDGPTASADAGADRGPEAAEAAPSKSGAVQAGTSGVTPAAPVAASGKPGGAAARAGTTAASTVPQGPSGARPGGPLGPMVPGSRPGVTVGPVAPGGGRTGGPIVPGGPVGPVGPGGPGAAGGPGPGPGGPGPGPGGPAAPAAGRAPAGPGLKGVGAARVTEAVRAARATVSAAARGPRRARLTVKRIDPWSVMKFSFAVAVVLFVVTIVATAMLYLALDAMGVVNSVNDSLAEMISAGGASSGDPFRVTAKGVFEVAALIGAVNVVLFTALATLGAFIYNVCADLAGGIELTLSERD